MPDICMDYQTDKRFGARLRALRIARGMSQEQLAAKLQLADVDLARGAIAKLEAGQRHIYLKELIALRSILGVSYDELLDLS